MRSTWTDERLDDFKTGVDSRLDELGRRIDGLSNRVDGLSARVDGLQHTMIQLFVASMAAMLAGFLALGGLILAQM